jgi:hypothetical protein
LFLGLIGVGKEILEDAMEERNGFIYRPAEFPASGVLVTTAIEVTGADLTYREVTLRAA